MRLELLDFQNECPHLSLPSTLDSYDKEVQTYFTVQQTQIHSSRKTRKYVLLTGSLSKKIFTVFGRLYRCFCWHPNFITRHTVRKARHNTWSFNHMSVAPIDHNALLFVENWSRINISRCFFKVHNYFSRPAVTSLILPLFCETWDFECCIEKHSIDIRTLFDDWKG